MGKKEYLPAIILSSAVLLGIGAGLNSIVEYLTAKPTAMEITRGFDSSKRKNSVIRLSELSSHQYLEQISNEKVIGKNLHENIDIELANIFIPNLGSNSNFIPNDTETNHHPDFALDCPGQCLYVESDDQQSYTRYDLAPGTILTARISGDYFSMFQHCSEYSSYCETGFFSMNKTYLVFDSDGDLYDYDKTNGNGSKSSLDSFVTRIADPSE